MKLQGFVAIVLGAVVASFVFAQSATETEAETSTEHEWEMFSQHVAGFGGTAGGGQSLAAGSAGGPVVGAMFLYNKRSGKVYSVFTDCGTDGPDGCVVAIPALDGTARSNTPTPQTGYSGVRSQ